MKDMIIVSTGFLVCSCFLAIFTRNKATMNTQFLITLITWSVFVYELARLFYPALSLAQPYRHYQRQAEMILVVVYGWEAFQYVLQKIDHLVKNSND